MDFCKTQKNKRLYYSIHNLLVSDFKDGTFVVRELLLLRRYVKAPSQEAARYENIILSICQQLSINENELENMVSGRPLLSKSNLDYTVWHYKSYIIHALLENFTIFERVHFNLFERNKGILLSLWTTNAIIFISIMIDYFQGFENNYWLRLPSWCILNTLFLFVLLIPFIWVKVLNSSD